MRKFLKVGSMAPNLRDSRDVMVMMRRGCTQSEVSKILICDLDKEYPSYPAKSGGFSDFGA